MFLCLSLVAAAAWLLMYKRLAETRPPQLCPVAARSLPRLYLRLLGEAYFMRYSLAIGCLYCTYFPFILQSPALLQRQLGLSSSAYALVFAATVAGYLLGSRLFQRLGALRDQSHVLQSVHARHPDVADDHATDAACSIRTDGTNWHRWGWSGCAFVVGSERKQQRNQRL